MQRRPCKCRRQRRDDEPGNGMAGETNRARAGDAALKPNKPFESARPGPFRPHGEAEHAYFEQEPSRS
jgi:hypothetical protein